MPAVADSVAYTLGRSVTVIGDHGPELVPAFYVSGHTFGFLGVAPMLGRPIQPSDIRPGGDAEQVAVLSFNLWRRMFHSASDVVGRTVMLSGAPHVIIGVMPRRFGWGSNSVPTNDGMYLPLSTTDAEARVRAGARTTCGRWESRSESVATSRRRRSCGTSLRPSSTRPHASYGRPVESSRHANHAARVARADRRAGTHSRRRCRQRRRCG